MQVCSDLGVAPVVMPEISDILQGRKTSAVCSALAYLASACVQAGIVVSLSPFHLQSFQEPCMNVPL